MVEVATTTEAVKDPEETYPGEECNCFRFVKNRVESLPRMADIQPGNEPYVGGVAIEWFDHIKHVSVITAVETDGVWVEESNYHHCVVGSRFIPFSKTSLAGFWVPG